MNYQAIASQGRYGDTTLVHMTPQEVSGLNALGAAYGRPMTINPTTGYPEAFNLRNLLPTIIGAGLNIASGGTLTPLMAGMITGTGYAVATGDPMKGLSAGLGAAGGAGFGSGLTASGATAAPVAGAPVVDPTVATTVTSTNPATQALINSGMTPEQAILQTQGSSLTTPSLVTSPTTTSAGTGTLSADLTAGLKEGASYGTSSGPTMGYNFSQAKEGIKALAGPEGREAFMSGIGGVGGLAKSTALSLAPEVADIRTPEAPEQVSYIRPYSLDIENLSGTPYTSSAEQRQLTYRFKEEEPYRAARGGHIRYQEGGAVDSATPVEGVYQNIANVQRMAGLPAIDIASMAPSLQAQMVAPRPQVQPVAAQPMSFRSKDYGVKMPDPTESQIYQDIQTNKRSPFDAFKGNMFGSPQAVIGYLEDGTPVYSPREDNGYAEGGLAGLREGRFLSGDGDGMSDEIPASIEGEVDALLSDGEFVIPADVVSHLGNGSSAAGAKVLYKMMDRIRKERTGNEEQAEEVEVEKILPA